MCKVEKCQECRVADATESIYMGSDDFGTDYLYTCMDCKNIHTALETVGNPDNHTLVVKTTECEINGTRDYLVEIGTNYRVRLFDRTSEGIAKAIVAFKDVFKNKRLYKMPE